MGNQASGEGVEDEDELDSQIKVQVQRKKGHRAYASPGSENQQYEQPEGPKQSLRQIEREYGYDEGQSEVSSYDQMESVIQNSKTAIVTPLVLQTEPVSIPVYQQPGPASFSPTLQVSEEKYEEEEEEDLQPVQILLQFIPYYGQGDPANDSIVRAALSSLSIEDIDSKDEYGNSLLLLACQYRCEDLVRIMINKGANPNALNSSGACCLHFACYKESSSIVIAKLLLQNGSNPEVQEYTYGCTPLHYCAGTGDVDFCQLLLSYGANVSTHDHYNYTCVDYAREAGMHGVAEYLQHRLDKYHEQNQARSRFTAPTPINTQTDSSKEWQSYVDPASGSKYYINSSTQECLWESDWLAKMKIHQSPASPAHLPEKQPPRSPVYKDSHDSRKEKDTQQAQAQLDEWLISQTTRARLIAFLSKHDPPRLVDVESLLVQYKGKEASMLKELCERYKVEEDPEFAAFQSKLSELKNENASSPKKAAPQLSTAIEFGKSTPISLRGTGNSGSKISSVPSNGCIADPDALARIQDEMEEQRSAFTTKMIEKDSTIARLKSLLESVNNGGSQAKASEAALQEERREHQVALSEREAAILKIQMELESTKREMREKYEAQLSDERATFRATSSDKDGSLAKLHSELDTLRTDKQNLEIEKSQMQEKLERAQMKSGDQLKRVEEQVDALKEENASLKTALATTTQDLNIEKEKLKSVESTMSNLTSGHEEMVAREKAQSDERAQQQRERERIFASELKAADERTKEIEAKFKADIVGMKAEWSCQERDLRNQHDKYRKEKESSISKMNRDMADQSARHAQELTEAKLMAEDLTKELEHWKQRAEEAETALNLAQQEIAEAREMNRYNAQLHKDILREQLARKKLHNEMEDLKGKIRVYVRVRPFSRSEVERGCTEAVVKDGKMSVLVKGIGGPDAKKNFDFDQVFGGPPENGNSQADIFRDTKHLIMSVVDGYNVCIFAYGQTGAGKSFTMIGAADIGSCIQENGDFDDLAGITPRAVSELFRLLDERQAQVTYVVEVQMFQLYRDGLEDLLVSKKGEKKKKGDPEPSGVTRGPLKVVLAEHSSTGLVQVEGAEISIAETPADVMRIFARGSARRTTSSTQMNAESSRSHLICSLVVKLTNRRSGKESVGKLTLVDLAGSERVDKSGAEGEQFKEAQSINKSLSALGDVIAALTSGQGHVPYRNHPLTMLMSDSIGGNAKTLMFVNTSPADYNSAESNSSLSFASRCKDITNSVGAASPAVAAAQMSALKKELAKLKKGGGGGGKGGTLTRPV